LSFSVKGFNAKTWFVIVLKQVMDESFR